MRKKTIKFTEDKAKQEELEKCYRLLSQLSPMEDEYSKVQNRIIELHKTDKQKVDKNVVVSGLFSTIPIIGIIAYEATGNIIKTKALGFVSKIRL